MSRPYKVINLIETNLTVIYIQLKEKEHRKKYILLVAVLFLGTAFCV